MAEIKDMINIEHKLNYKTEMSLLKNVVPTADIDFSQFNPNNIIDWGKYIEIDDEKKLLLHNIMYGNTPYLIEGDKGIGKTLMVHTICRESKIALIEYSCSNGTNKGDLIGKSQINSNGSYFELGILPLAFEVANHFSNAVLYIDEINATEHEVMKLFNRPFDKRKSVLANGKIYKLNNGCRLSIVATMNPIHYSGVNALTEDLRSRFIGDVLSYPNVNQLELIIDWTDIPIETVKNPLLILAQETHALKMKGDIDYVLSPRDLVQFCEYYNGLKIILPEKTCLNSAVKHVILIKYGEIEERELIKTRVNEIFGIIVK